jgi:hypothetical protein
LRKAKKNRRYLMFLHTPTLKKLFKKAYGSTGLMVANFDGQIYVAGGYWAISLDVQYLPNRVKAAIIEHCGELPERDQVFKATKEEIQYGIPLSSIYDLRKDFKNAKTTLSKTPVVIEKSWFSCRLYQVDSTHEFKAVSKELLSMIDIREMEQEFENMPSGPSCRGEHSDIVYWQNATCTLALCTFRLDAEQEIEILNTLKQIDFAKEDK